MVVILLVLGTLWVLYKLTTVILLLVLSVFFAYLVSPLVEIVRRPRLHRRAAGLPSHIPVAIAISYVLIFAGYCSVIYFVVPQLASQYPQFAQQAQGYAQTISGKTRAFNEYLRQHRMPDSVLRRISDEVPEPVGQVGGSRRRTCGQAGRMGGLCSLGRADSRSSVSSCSKTPRAFGDQLCRCCRADAGAGVVTSSFRMSTARSRPTRARN